MENELFEKGAGAEGVFHNGAPGRDGDGCQPDLQYG